MQFTTKNNSQTDLDVDCSNKLIYKLYGTKFLALYWDSPLVWKINILQNTHRLRAAC